MSGPGFAKQQSKSDFFESRIRPVLVEHCYECHNSSGKKKGGLALDWRNPLRAAEDVIVPGKPDDSLLVLAVRQLHCPPKLTAAQCGLHCGLDGRLQLFVLLLIVLDRLLILADGLLVFAPAPS